MDLFTHNTPFQERLFGMDIIENNHSKDQLLSKDDTEREPSDDSFTCSVCDTKLSDIKHYQIHLGTKKHKRNIRNLRREVLSQDNSHLQARETSEDSCRYTSLREKYWQKSLGNFESNYTSYIWSVTAYWISKLLTNPTVKDFKISLSIKKWGNFGDVVIEIQFNDFPGKPSVTATYAIQFRHIVSNYFRGIDSLSNGSFGLQHVLSNLAKVKGEIDLINTKFVVFTTAAVSPLLNLYEPVSIEFCNACFKLLCQCNCKLDGKENKKEIPVFARPLSNRRRNIIETSVDTQSIYYFTTSDNRFILPRISFYTSQKRPGDFPAAIDALFSEVLNDRHIPVSKELIKYVENWDLGRCGGTYKLKKEDILVKLGDIFLSKFRVTPKVQPMNSHCPFDIWVQAVNSAHVTVLQGSSVNLSKICEPFNLQIETELGIKINITDDTMKFKNTNGQDDLKKITNPILISYFFEEISKSDIYNDISLEKVFLVFWKAGLIPMILQVEDLKDQEYVLQIISFLKTFGLNRRYFLKTPDMKIKTAVERFKNLSFFVSLDDIIEKLHPSLLNRVKINVTENFSLSLEAIRETDKFFQKSISTNEFFDMTLGKYVFKPFSSYRVKRIGEELKLVLSKKEMKVLRQEVESKNDFQYLLRKPVTQSNYLCGLDPKLFG